MGSNWLFGGMNSGQAMQAGTQIFQKMAQEQQQKQDMAFEKQKFDLLKALQQQQVKNEQARIKIQQDKLAWEKEQITQAKGEEKVAKEERKGIAYGGRRSAKIKPLEAMARKGFVQTGQSDFLNLLQPEKPKGPFTLSPGQQLVTEKGIPLFAAPGKPEKETFTHIKSSQSGLYNTKTKHGLFHLRKRMNLLLLSILPK